MRQLIIIFLILCFKYSGKNIRYRPPSFNIISNYDCALGYSNNKKQFDRNSVFDVKIQLFWIKGQDFYLFLKNKNFLYTLMLFLLASLIYFNEFCWRSYNFQNKRKRKCKSFECKSKCLYNYISNQSVYDLTENKSQSFCIVRD